VPDGARQRHHLVVVGASAGGVEALRLLVAGLPSDFPAAVLVVLHLPPTGISVLPEILGRACELPVAHAADREMIEGGRIYVGPPRFHLKVFGNRIHLDPGASVNGHRPSVDPLFQTAAHSHGAAVVGVVLSGVLDDGTLGLAAVKRHGGTTIVQDPADALYPGMPTAALEHVEADFVVPATEIGSVLAASATSPPTRPTLNPGMHDETLVEVDRGSSDDPQPGSTYGLTCPDCNGGIWEDEVDGVPVYRCRVGHAYGLESFLAAQNGRVENALWTALRALEERAALTRRLAGRLRSRGAASSAGMFERRANATIDQAVVIRELLHALEAEAAGAGAREAAQ
jgi:two-component system, chemotaxis family, protein-glutamate methylesterase/glutaminase